MSIISIPYTFSPGGTIVSSQVNSDFSTIYNDYNGSIGNSNLSPSIVISDSKLAQITSASKVSGTALTGLSSTPSGAGIFPSANLPSQFASSVILGVRSTTTQNITSSTWTQVTFNTVDKDSGGYWSSNTYTPLIAGWYLINFTDSITNSGGQDQSQIAIYINGSLYVSTSIGPPTAAAYQGGTVSALAQCNGSTDNISFYAWSANHNSTIGGLQSGSNGTSASIVRVF